MAADLILYTNPMSRGRIARWMLEEVGEPYETQILAFGPTMHAEAYRAVNPMAKVPAIQHQGVVITEAAAICAYLADAFPHKHLAPPLGNVARGPYFRWMFFGAGPIEAATTNKSMNFVAPKEKFGMLGYGSLERVLITLDDQLKAQEFIAGPVFTAADVYVGSQIRFGLMFGSIEKRASFEDYARRMSARPAAIRATEIDDALVAAQPKA